MGNQKIPSDMRVAIIHKSKESGNFKIVNYYNARKVKVEFIETGYTITKKSSCIRRGSVHDPYYPSVYGVGFKGEGIYQARKNGNITKEYVHWQSMMRRCYSDKWHERKPTYIECEVCEEWQEFQKFAEWFEENYPKDNNTKYQLDKDILNPGNKIYSPENCIFVTPSENTIDSNKRQAQKRRLQCL